MGKILRKLEITDSTLSWGERFLYWGQLLTSGAIGGAGLGLAANAADALSAYSPFSWVLAAMLGVLIGIFSVLGFIALMTWNAKRKFYSLQGKKSEGVNPLDSAFHKKIIDINIFRTPNNEPVEDKTFDGCEIMGPAPVLFRSRASFISNTFANCDLIKIKDEAQTYNTLVFDGITVTNSRLHHLTIMVPKSMVKHFKELKGGNWLN